MRIYFTFFCEHVSEGSYGRLNCFGILPQKQIAIPHLNYIFKGYIAIWMSAESVSVKKKLNFYKPDGSLLNTLDLPDFADDSIEKTFCVQLTWPFDSFGNYKVEIIFEDGVDNYSREFLVVEGSASSLNLDKDEILPQIVLGDGDQIQAQDLFKRIFKRARKSILVIDNFWTTKELSYLLKEVNQKIDLLLYIKNDKEIIKDTEKIKSIHPNTIVDSSNKIHDRYICLDGDSEIWQIGSSLNHAGKRVMTINQIISIDAINKLKSEINSIFPKTFN